MGMRETVPNASQGSNSDLTLKIVIHNVEMGLFRLTILKNAMIIIKLRAMDVALPVK